jgi:hypothetical protein
MRRLSTGSSAFRVCSICRAPAQRQEVRGYRDQDAVGGEDRIQREHAEERAAVDDARISSAASSSSACNPALRRLRMVGPLPNTESTLISSAWAGISCVRGLARRWPHPAAAGCPGRARRRCCAPRSGRIAVDGCSGAPADRGRPAAAGMEFARRRRGEIQRRGGLADSALLVENCHPHGRRSPSLSMLYRDCVFT